MNEVHQAVMTATRGARPVLKQVDVTGRVTGLLFEVCAEQRYANESKQNIEAVYSFPLPWRAVLLDMEFIIGERTLRGQVAPKADSELRYEAALEQGDTAVMLEQAGDGLYTVNVGNLLAGEQAVVRLRYAMLLSFEQEQVRISIPTAIAPRYGNPAAAHLRVHQTPFSDMLADYPCTVAITLAGVVGHGKISSPSHAIATRKREEGVEVSLAGAARLDRDVILLVDDLHGESLAAIAQDGEHTVVLTSICPSLRKPGAVRPLAIKILVDCSGSMAGDSIDSARKALHCVMQELEPQDRFSYSRFGGTLIHNARDLLPASGPALRDAATWIAATQANLGGTEIAYALQRTYELGTGEEADILLITDGEVWGVEPLVAAAAASGQRIFAVGIGSAPAASLLKALAERTGGACEFIGVNDDVQGGILRMFRRMRQSPAREVAMQWGVPAAWQCDPAAAVFHGETVHAFAAFAGTPPASVSMVWQCDGLSEQAAVALDGQVIRMPGDTLARVAAATRMRQMDKAQQKETALNYQLVSEWTNLLLIHQRADEEKPADLPALHAVPQMMAAGWGGTGTASVRHDMEFMKAPAVWRRESASAQFRVMQRSPAMESYDIPAFLRKSTPKTDASPAMLEIQDLVRNLPPKPRSLDDLASCPVVLMEQLRTLCDEGFDECEVVLALCAVLADYGVAPDVALPALPELESRIRVALTALIGPPPQPSKNPVKRVARWWRRNWARDDYGIPAFLRRAAD